VWVHSWIFLQVLVAIRVFAPFSCARLSDAGTDFCDSSACRVSSAGQVPSPVPTADSFAIAVQFWPSQSRGISG
jgi:hypothetical protein